MTPTPEGRRAGIRRIQKQRRLATKPPGSGRASRILRGQLRRGGGRALLVGPRG